MLTLYRAASSIGGPLIRAYLGLRRARGKEDGARFPERLGRAGRARPEGPLVWAHAASVGESLSLLPLLERLVADWPGLNIVMTTGTVSSARVLEGRLPARCFHQFIPVDRVAYVRRFLDHWRPSLALWAESEFWPNMIVETTDRGIPMVLINGRVSPRSFAGWRRFPGLIRALLGRFRKCLAQAETDAERLRALGAPDARCVGNLKYAVPPLPVDEAELARLRAAVGGRPVWLAASTHAGEEEIAADTHRILKAIHPGLLTVIVPRHAERGAGIAALLRGRGLTVARRAAGEAIVPATDVYLADTMGELGLFYRLAGIAFMGKSLVPLGGQNPLEAARLGSTIIHGPHMMNFEDVCERLNAAGAAVRVANADGLRAAVARLIADGGERARLAEAARALVEREAHVLDAVTAEIEAFLKPLFEERAARART